MKFNVPDKMNSREWVSRFSLLPTKLDDSGNWIWLERYEQRLVQSYWLSKDGSVPLDGAAAFVFERRCQHGQTGTVKKYQSD